MADAPRPSLIERLGLDDPGNLRAVGWALPLAAALGGGAFIALLGRGALVALAGAALVFLAAVLVVAGGAIAFTHLVARGIGSFLLPGGGGTGAEDFSRELSLIEAGRVEEALEWMEARMEAEPENVALALLAADSCARHASDPRRAARLFRAARERPGATAGQDLYATNRLVDLCLGPLDDRKGAARELRRILARHPGSRAAAEVERLLRTL